MLPPTIDPPSVFLAAGLLYLVLPATAWTILHGRHDPLSVALWCGGGMLHGLGFILMGLRDTAPAWATFVAAYLLLFIGYGWRVVALLRELRQAKRWLWIALACLVASVAYVVAYDQGVIPAPRLIVALCAQLAGALALAWLSWLLYRRNRFRSGAMLSGAHALLGVALMVRLGAVTVQWETAQGLGGGVGLEIVFILIAGLVAAIYANSGYIGIALEAEHATSVARGSELAREHEARVQSESRVREQAHLLEERARLLAQREEMLAALAHEVRQPLNNASAALHNAEHAMAHHKVDRDRTALQLQRASAVLTQVASALDNTLADAALLGGDKPFVWHDSDVDTLVDLSIADIAPAARQRVRRERATDTRTASMNHGLMRLALRNLITNALAYSPADSPVVVRIADSDDPLALLIEVSDQGPGIPPDLMPRLFTRGARGHHSNNVLGHGLGLFIVRRVMEMHGGEVRVTPHTPRGLTMTLVIPQGLAG